jgi:hypothetical protein
MPVAPGAGADGDADGDGDAAAFDAAVDALHARFVVALRELYDTHKGTCGYADTALVIR